MLSHSFDVLVSVRISTHDGSGHVMLIHLLITQHCGIFHRRGVVGWSHERDRGSDALFDWFENWRTQTGGSDSRRFVLVWKSQVCATFGCVFLKNCDNYNTWKVVNPKNAIFIRNGPWRELAVSESRGENWENLNSSLTLPLRRYIVHSHWETGPKYLLRTLKFDTDSNFDFDMNWDSTSI